jgi:hypothetical protein
MIPPASAFRGWLPVLAWSSPQAGSARQPQVTPISTARRHSLFINPGYHGTPEGVAWELALRDPVPQAAPGIACLLEVLLRTPGALPNGEESYIKATVVALK